MTAFDFRAAVKALGTTQGKLAVKLGVQRNAVSAWATGARPVPGPVRAYLELAMAVRSLPV